jgi:hypothetical protein
MVILSPVDPVLEGPNGEQLSGDTNTFADAELLTDDEDPSGPKLIGINNPPPGQYLQTLSGTKTNY